MNLFIDTHSHLYLPQFDNDRNQCIERAVDKGVDKIVLPNIDAESISALNNMLEQYSEICCGLMGLHPTHVKANFRQELDAVFSALEAGKYKGVGEIGIDLYWDKTHLKEQTEAFLLQVNYALAHDLPIVIHARDSFNEIFGALESIDVGSFKGIFHAFTGNIKDAKRAIDMGLLIGIGGIVTFKNAHLANVVEQLDLNHLVLETDSPYLAPTPYRGKRNESSYIPLIAEKIASIKNTSVEEVARVTTNNAEMLFNL